MLDDFTSIIAQGAKDLKIELPPGAGAAFGTYYDFLENHGQNVNLTAISGTGEVAKLHFLDSIALINVAKFENAKVIDVGSGAGFPGVPLKIVEPSLELTLLEPTGKRVDFLTELLDKLRIDATVLKARAEDVAREPEKRESFDIVLSRAVARLNILCELCLPFVSIGGLFIAMKGTDTTEELQEAQSAIKALSAELLDHSDYTIPGTAISHRAVVIRKIRTTKDKYPRRYAKIKNSPL